VFIDLINWAGQLREHHLWSYLKQFSFSKEKFDERSKQAIFQSVLSSFVRSTRTRTWTPSLPSFKHFKYTDSNLLPIPTSNLVYSKRTLMVNLKRYNTNWSNLKLIECHALDCKLVENHWSTKSSTTSRLVCLLR